jgi:hypothetical protein
MCLSADDLILPSDASVGDGFSSEESAENLRMDVCFSLGVRTAIASPAPFRI